MPMVKMNARRRFKLDGHFVEEGHEIEVPSTYARVLESRGEAAPQAAAVEKKARKGQYKTRVMAAEQPAPAPEPPPAEPPPPPPDEGEAAT